MRSIDLSALSSRYAVRRLGPDDADLILALCAENPQFYAHSPAACTRDQVLRDLALTPPGIPPAQKHCVGFFDGSTLVAVMDLVDGYPDADTAFIGFFMVDAAWQGRGVGGAIVEEALASLRSLGYAAVRLAIDEGNPQSTAFWTKHGFAVLRRIPREEGAVLLAERRILSSY